MKVLADSYLCFKVTTYPEGWLPLVQEDYPNCRMTTCLPNDYLFCMTTNYAVWWLSVLQDDYLCCSITTCTAGWLPALLGDYLCCRWLCRMTTCAAEWLHTCTTERLLYLYCCMATCAAGWLSSCRNSLIWDGPQDPAWCWYKPAEREKFYTSISPFLTKIKMFFILLWNVLIFLNVEKGPQLGNCFICQQRLDP